MLKKNAAILFLLSSVFVYMPAALGENCSTIQKRIGAYSFHRFEAVDGKCFMGALPMDTSKTVYRSLKFTNEGMLMVFNSIDEESYGVSDGARVFYFFPRNQMPTVIDHNDTLQFSSATKGIDLILGLNKSGILGMNGGQVYEDPKIHPENEGGVELKNMQSVYLDCGFKVGASPTGEPNRKSKFVGPAGKTCVVRNKEVFSYDSSGEPTFKFTDAKLKVFLNSRCPALNINF